MRGTDQSAEQDGVMQLQSMYQEIIQDHYRHPHHKGLREPYDAEAHHINPVCGDEVTVRVLLTDEARVSDVSYDPLGCMVTQASASGMADSRHAQDVPTALSL